MPNFGGAQTPQNVSTLRGQGSVKTSKLSTLTDDERKWSDNVLRVLKLPNKGAHARVLANAVSSAQMIQSDVNASQQDKQSAQLLLQTVTSCGEPPWKDMRSAMRATSASAKLNLLSIPSNTRSLNPVGGNGVNLSFWIDRIDGDGSKRAAFLCKPMTQYELANKPAGIPHRGEVPREAMSGSAAKWFAGEGFDIGMPETHVMKLPTGLFPQNPYLDGTALEQTCSVQEARPSLGDLKSNDPTVKDHVRNADRDKVAALAMFDTITLNTDRHSGNILVGPDGALIPIDHGASFIEPGESTADPFAGLERLCGTIAAPHNAMLGLPSAHEPLSQGVAKKLKALKSSEYASELKKDRDALAQEEPTAGTAPNATVPLVSDAAIEMSRRAAWFVKRAAKWDPPFSPASIQTALGGSAMALLDPAVDEQTFETNAETVLARMAPQQEIVKQFGLAGDGAYAAMVKLIEERGWTVGRRGGAPGGWVPDPPTMIALYQSGEVAPVSRSAKRDRLKQLTLAAPVSAQSTQQAMAQLQRAAIDRLKPHIQGTDIDGQILRVTQGKAGKELLDALSRLLDALSKVVLREAPIGLNALRLQWTIPNNDNRLQALEQAIRIGDPIGAAEALAALRNAAGSNAYQPVVQNPVPQGLPQAPLRARGGYNGPRNRPRVNQPPPQQQDQDQDDQNV